jgi:hypothetical protein
MPVNLQHYILKRDREEKNIDRWQNVLDTADAVYMALSAFERSVKKDGSVTYPNQKLYRRWHKRLERKIYRELGQEIERPQTFWDQLKRSTKLN